MYDRNYSLSYTDEQQRQAHLLYLEEQFKKYMESHLVETAVKVATAESGLSMPEEEVIEDENEHAIMKYKGTDTILVHTSEFGGRCETWVPLDREMKLCRCGAHVWKRMDFNGNGNPTERPTDSN